MSLNTIIDSVGRNIIGVVTGETPETITLRNAAMIACTPTQNGQLQIQLIPLFLGELIKPDAKGNREYDFTYTKSQVAIGSNIIVDDRIVAQYQKLVETTFAKPNIEPKTVNLFTE